MAVKGAENDQNGIANIRTAELNRGTKLIATAAVRIHPTNLEVIQTAIICCTIIKSGGIDNRCAIVGQGYFCGLITCY